MYSFTWSYGYLIYGLIDLLYCSDVSFQPHCCISDSFLIFNTFLPETSEKVKKILWVLPHLEFFFSSKTAGHYWAPIRYHWSEPSLSCINLLPYTAMPSALICRRYWHFVAQIDLCHYIESTIQIPSPLVQLQDLLDRGLIVLWGSLDSPALHQLQFDALWPSRFFLRMV